MEFENIIVMKVGPHSGMSLDQIIDSKLEEEKVHGVHYWGYSGYFAIQLRYKDFARIKKMFN